MRGPGGGGEEIRSRVSRYVRYHTSSCVESRVGTYVRSPRLHTTYYYLTSFFKPQFQLRRVCVGQTFPRPAFPSHPSFAAAVLPAKPPTPSIEQSSQHECDIQLLKPIDCPSACNMHLRVSPRFAADNI